MITIITHMHLMHIKQGGGAGPPHFEFIGCKCIYFRWNVFIRMLTRFICTYDCLIRFMLISLPDQALSSAKFKGFLLSLLMCKLSVSSPPFPQNPPHPNAPETLPPPNSPASLSNSQTTFLARHVPEHGSLKLNVLKLNSLTLHLLKQHLLKLQHYIS